MEIFNEEEWNQFRKDHPELRFWQAMRAYLYVERIVIEYRDDGDITREDTFYWQDEKDNKRKLQSRLRD